MYLKKCKQLIILLLLLTTRYGLFGQDQVPLSGTILSDSGLVVPSATIKVTNAKTNSFQYTTSDEQGRFTFQRLSIGSRYEFIVTAAGYETSSLSYTIKQHSNSLLLRMLSKTTELEQIVVVGYGSQKKSDVVGAISGINSGDITRTPVASVSNALTGRIPGLITQQANGTPGKDAASLNIRGFGSPLVLVDGMQLDLNSISSEEIESISVLKDASASVFGSRAGNGVILVTTKRGRKGKPVIDYNGAYTMQGATSMPRPASSGMYAEMLREQWIQAGNPAQTAPYTEAEIAKFYNGGDPQYPNTNWMKVLLRDWAPQQNHNLSVRGGSELIKYYGYLGYLDQKTLWKKSGADYSRINFRANIDATITRNLTSRMDFSAIYKNGKYPARNMDISNSIWGDFWNTRSIYPAELPDPTKISYAEGGGTGGAHITSNRDLAGYSDYKNQEMRFIFSLNYTVPFLQGLSVKALLDYYQSYYSGKKFQRPVNFYKYDYAADIYQLAGSFGSTANLTLDRNNSRQILNQYYLNYDRTFGDHVINAQAIYELIDYYDDAVTASRSNFLTPAIEEMLAGSTNGMTNGATTSTMGRSSIIGRLNYNYKGKYFVESTLRADASAKFPSHSRWGYFPGIMMAWHIEKEKFMSQVSNVSDLKLRLSYGESGNDNTGNFQYLTGYQITDGSTGGSYVFGSTRYPGILSSGLANTDITWEKLKIYNAGLDFGFLKHSIYGSLDVFLRERTGILATRAVTLPSSFGAALPAENLNSMSTRGFELMVGYRFRRSGFSADIAANLSWSRSRWTHYDEPSYSDPDQQKQLQKTGQWVDRTFGYVAEKLFTSNDEISKLTYDQDGRKNSSLRPGDIKYADINGDGVISWKDQIEIGKGTAPHWMTGLNGSLGYKQFDLAFLFQGALGYNILASIPQFSTVYYESRWTEKVNNDHSRIPRLGGSSMNGYQSTWNIINASYLRLKNLSLGYKIPVQLLQKLGLQRARIYLSGTNLWLISALKKYDLDPEGPTGTGGMYYPQQKTYSAGIDISL